jgi:hypothetical protein
MTGSGLFPRISPPILTPLVSVESTSSGLRNASVIFPSFWASGVYTVRCSAEGRVRELPGALNHDGACQMIGSFFAYQPST